MLNKKTLFLLVIFLSIIIGVVFYLVLRKNNFINLELQQIFKEKIVSPKGGRYGRVEAIKIGSKLFMAFTDLKTKKFKLVEINEDLSYKSQIVDIFSDSPQDSIDIRLSSDGKNLWYPFESMTSDKQQGVNSCNHFLNMAKYDISKNPYELINSNVHIISNGCSSTRESFQNPPLDIPENPEAADDPTPLFYKGKYVVLTRAWFEGTVEHIRIFDNNFNKIEDFTLDLKSAIGDRSLSQNALVEIQDQAYLIGGLGNGAPADSSASSGIYAIPLSNDLHSVSGEIIPLVTGPDRYYLKTTKAIHYNRKLYINYFKAIGGGQWAYLGIFDVENNFTPLNQIQIQEKSITAFSHSSFEIAGDKIYVFYQGEDENKIPIILGKVFKLKL